jgi:hypothetical protein
MVSKLDGVECGSFMTFKKESEKEPLFSACSGLEGITTNVNKSGSTITITTRFLFASLNIYQFGQGTTN